MSGGKSGNRWNWIRSASTRRPKTRHRCWWRCPSWDWRCRGLVSLVLSLVGLDGAIVGTLPVLDAVFSLSLAVPILIFDVGVFVVSMRQWESAVDT